MRKGVITPDADSTVNSIMITSDSTTHTIDVVHREESWFNSSYFMMEMKLRSLAMVWRNLSA